MSEEESPCTDCGDTGITFQTERPCTCDAATPLAKEEGDLATLIETRLLGVHHDDQDLYLEDHDWQRIIAALRASPPEKPAPAPQLLNSDESKALLARAEQLWADLQANNLGGFSGINRPFYILHEFRHVIEGFGNRDTGLQWSKDQLDALPPPRSNDDERPA